MSDQGKLTILFLAANPVGTDPLCLDKELSELQNALRPFRSRFVIESKWAVHIKDMRRAMDDYCPTIVHFSGHGNEEGIQVEGDDGQPRLVTQKALTEFFALYPNVQCVIFNACYTDALIESVAHRVPCVIGMRSIVTDQAAIKFAEAFYDSIGAGKSYQLAFDGARVALLMEGLFDEAKPVIRISSEKLSIPATKSNGDDRGEVELQLLHKQLDALRIQLDIQLLNLNQYQIERAKYGGELIPRRLENAIADAKQEIESTNNQIQKIKLQINEFDC